MLISNRHKNGGAKRQWQLVLIGFWPIFYPNYRRHWRLELIWTKSVPFWPWAFHVWMLHARFQFEKFSIISEFYTTLVFSNWNCVFRKICNPSKLLFSLPVNLKMGAKSSFNSYKSVFSMKIFHTPMDFRQKAREKPLWSPSSDTDWFVVEKSNFPTKDARHL